MTTPEPAPATPPAEAQPEFLARTFAGWRSQRGMLADVHRTGSFARAIAAVVTPGMTVADVGCGSGILSLFAARAGAARVHALEATRMIEDAAEVARANGFDGDRIEFVPGDARHFVAPGGVDAVIGEWIGMYLFEASSCSTTITVLPRSRNSASVASRRALSRWCRPMLGSSSTYVTPTNPAPIWLARRMRCPSPPDSDGAARSSDK